MATRKTIGDRLRFEVFKRDMFTCQYCGKKAPDVVLNIDHIKPVADGGNNGIMNLVTSCRDCNSGKSDVALNDGSAVAVARVQAEAMQERRGQIKMLADWHVEMASMKPEIEAITRIINAHKNTLTITETGEKIIRRIVKQHGLSVVMEATARAFAQYSQDRAFDMIEKICRCMEDEKKRPGIGEIWRVVRGATSGMNGPSWADRGAVEALWKLKGMGYDWHQSSRSAEKWCKDNRKYNRSYYIECLERMEAMAREPGQTSG